MISWGTKVPDVGVTRPAAASNSVVSCRVRGMRPAGIVGTRTYRAPDREAVTATSNGCSGS